MVVPIWATLLILTSIAGDVASVRSTGSETRGEDDQGSHGSHGGADTKLTPCIVAQRAAAGWADAFVPDCTDDGFFERRQCHLFVRTCWCVDSATGAEIDGTRRRFDEGVLDCDKHVPHTTEIVTSLPTSTSLPPTPPSEDSKETDSDSPCLAAQQAVAGQPEAFLPSCSVSGLFERRQCHYFVMQCWCVDPATGTEVEGSRKSLDEGVVDCDRPNGPAGPCHVARSRSSGLMGAFVPQCTDDGKFRTLQCHGSTGYCWCVNEAGVEMENTRKGPSEGPVDCDAVKPANDPAGPCHVARSRSSGLMGAYVPQCTDDGKFRTLQCHGSTGYCWCVNEDGVEMENTRKSPSEGLVDCDAARPANGTAGPCHVARSRSSGLIGSYVPQCTDDGKFTTMQCHGSTGYCWCVNEDGVEMENTRKSPSEGPVDCSDVGSRGDEASASETPTPTPPATPKPTPPATPTPTPPATPTPTALPPTAPPRSCSLPPLTGPCDDVLMRWYFDRETETCKQFAYGGCEGNGNNFDSKTKCEFACPPNGCPAIDCDLTCQYSYQVDSNNCHVCRCTDPCSRIDCASGQSCVVKKIECGAASCPSEVTCVDDAPEVPSYCSLPTDAGTCDNNTMRWYFNSESKSCIEFSYRGCGGNRNNFKTKIECVTACQEPCPLAMCLTKCKFGYKKGDNGCYTCNCYEPCEGVDCSHGDECVAVNTTCAQPPCAVIGHCTKKGRIMRVDCTNPADAGPCGAEYPRWFYDSGTKECRKFFYGGCHGNSNNFEWREDCERVCMPEAHCRPVMCLMGCSFGFERDSDGCEICECVDPCKGVSCSDGEHCQSEQLYCASPPCAATAKCIVERPNVPSVCSFGFEAGGCSERVQKWFYNATSDQCVPRNFSSCYGNNNRFENRNQCESTCKPTTLTCRPVTCRMMCPFGFAKADNGCAVCQCINPCQGVTCRRGEICLPERRSCEKSPCPVVGKCFATRSDLEAKCSLPLEVGLCSSRQSRWFFNTTSSHCEAFNYTGCRGNDNRFETRSACKQTCEPHRCEPVRCKMFCPFGWVKDVNGCDICQCVNPCKNVTCLETERCMPERRACMTSSCPVLGRCFPKRPDLDSRCTLAQDVGLCTSDEMKWFFNVTSNKCEAFNFTGCRGNRNRFDSKTECDQACEPHRCEPVRCRMFCPFGWAKDESGCEICQCVNPCKDVPCSEGERCLPERRPCPKSPCPVVGRCFATRPDLESRCSMTIDVGSCNSREQNWFFNVTSNKCEAFNYTGCRGNGNRFDSVRECNQTCVPHRCEPVRCRMFCPFGWAKDESGCEICKCVNPCKDVRCSDGEHCLPERRQCDKSPCPVVGKCFAKRPHMESRCSLAQEVGLCNSRELKWFFNVTSNKCEAFNYTGCRGNGNRFNSTTECNETCEPHRCEPVRCKMFCPFGWAKDESGCEICQCVNPCEGVRCSDSEHCLPERRQCVKSPCPVVGKCYAKRPDLASRCSLALEVGLCHSRELRWFFNVTSNKCEAFNYTGCRGNGNRFDSVRECNQTCVPHRCEPVRCKMFCPFGWAKDESGCEICKCVNPCKDVSCSNREHCLPERRQCDKSPCPVVGKCFAKRPDMESRCSLAQEVGLCNSRELRWFFNVTSNKCEAFNYTGCRGNGNRFNSMTECNETCEPHRCEPVRCRMFCPFGWAKDESGCEICKCVNPCEDVRCSDGEHCLPERRQCDKSPCPVVGKCFAKRPDMESRCSLAQEVGLCNSRELKWFFNVTSNKCEAFNYTGCRGNGNRFNSMTECNETCEPHRCEPVRCRMFCPFGWAKDESGCEICKCVNPCEDVRCSDGEHCLPERRQCDKSPCPVVGKCFAKRPDVESRCSLAQEVGLCNSRELKWFFNVTSNKCEAFNYTGCRGNGNRFDSKTECNQTCAPHHCEPVRCRMFCPFGWAKDENGCEICECVNPCEDVSCNENERCLPERNLCNKSPCPVVGKCFPKRPDLEPSCSLALEVGLCNSRELKWFFNVTSNKCQAFNYTGCRGNGNRFDSKEACGLTCTASGCTKVRCLMFCPFGFVKDDNGCDICRCINPCRGVSCPDGKRCFPERRSCNTSAPCPVTAKCIAVRTDIPALCSVPSDFGLCANRTTRWYFDTEADQCKEFIYGGCRGNMNNFESQSRCGAVCQPSLCQPLSCDGQCEFGWDRDVNGCRVCRCRDPCKDIRCSNGMICDGKQAKCVRLRTIPADCRLPRKPGMCRAYFPRWFYNATEGACQRFVYGGCQANANNFKTKTKCEDNCLPSPCPDMSHCGMCEHGMKKDVRGCDICECSDNPCASKPCDDNMRCEVMSGNCSGPGCQTVARCVPHNATECPPVCARFCEYGFDKAPDGCPICHCHDPCKTVNCGQGFTCKVKRCSRGNPECQPIGICVPKSATSTESPERLRVKPGLCPENEQMGMGICAEMCAYDMSCPGAKKCCSNGCGHVCTDPVTVPPPMNTTTTAAPANVTSKPQLCPDGSSARNCTGVCERASCEETTTTSASRCIADPCNKCRFVFQDFSHRNICSGWLCPATNESRLCDAQNMCGSNPTCQWMPDANCVDDHCNCRATFVDEFNLPMDCDTELTTCQRMQTHAQARSKVVSDLWVPDCDGYGRFKAQQQNWGFSWCVDPLGHRLENTNVRGPSQADCSLRNITSVIGSLRLDADYETTMNDKTKFMEYMEPQIADMMMVPEEQVAIFKVEAGSVVIYFNVRADRSDQVSLLSKAGRFERLVRAGKLRLVYEGRPLNVVDGGKSFRFGFVYADEPSSDASAADMSRGVIIAITIVACAGLLGVLLVSMVCVSWCKRRKVYEVEEKTIPAFENPRYMSTDELKEKL